MPRGGKRQGTAGRSYSNRTDLAQNYAPPKPVATPAPAEGNPLSPAGPHVGVTPDMIPSLDAPTQRPGEPVTHGLALGAGAGPEVLSAPADPIILRLQAAYTRNPTPELRRALNLLASKGA